jgi:hypothetical protein
MMHYNRKEINKTSTLGKKKKNFNAKEREREVWHKGERNDGHKERKRLLA